MCYVCRYICIYVLVMNSCTNFITTYASQWNLWKAERAAEGRRIVEESPSQLNVKFQKAMRSPEFSQ